jgi:hypothetical protein
MAPALLCDSYGHMKKPTSANPGMYLRLLFENHNHSPSSNCCDCTSRCACPGLRAIDLLCQMLAPAAAGITMSYAGMLPAVAVMAAYAAAAWVPETLLLRFAYAHCGLLR